MPLLWVILHFVASGLLMALVNWLGLRAWRRAAAEHWTERARRLWPVRYTAGINILLLPASLALLHAGWAPEDTSWVVANGVAGLLGAVLGCYPLERAMFPTLDFPTWARQFAALPGLRLGLVFLFFMAMVFMPDEDGGGMVLIAGGYLALTLLVLFGGFFRYLRLIGYLEPAGPRLQQIVADSAVRMQVGVRNTWQARGVLANAFASPTTKELIFTNRLLELCTDEEVAVICAHELAHLTESKMVLAGRLLGALVFFPLLFMHPAVHSLGQTGLLVPLAGLVLMLIFVRRLSQRMEKRADALAAQEQTNEGVYARALEKLYEANQTPAVNVNNRQTHPHLYDRMVAAGVTPDYPRPARPRKLTWAGWVVVLVFVVLPWTIWVFTMTVNS